MAAAKYLQGHTGRLNRWRKYRSKGVCGTGHYPGKGI